jgi:hypothetical protein
MAGPMRDIGRPTTRLLHVPTALDLIQTALDIVCQSDDRRRRAEAPLVRQGRS